jgi:hypothetical protein
MTKAETNARKVVKQMHDMLPVELCDLVYSYLIPRHTIQDISNVFSSNFPDIPRYPGDLPMFDGIPYTSEGYASLPLPPPPPPPPAQPFFYPPTENLHPPEYTHPGGRIFRPEYISQNVAVEAAKLYYQGNTFKVFVSCHSREFDQLLITDRFGLGLEPFALIQKLYLELPAECCRSRRCHRIRRNRPTDANADEMRRLGLYRTELATNLDLLPTKRRSKIEVTLVITLRYPNKSEDVLTAERYFLNMLSVIQGIVYDLKQHGSKVRVCAMVRFGNRVDITSLFPLSAEEWQEVCLLRVVSVLYADPAPENCGVAGRNNVHPASLGQGSFRATFRRHQCARRAGSTSLGLRVFPSVTSRCQIQWIRGLW